MRVTFATLFFLTACRTSDPIDADPQPKKDVPSASATASSDMASMAIGVKSRGIELVAAPPGNVAAVVRSARDMARAHGRALVVYIGATWCEPCQRFHHAAEEGKLDDKFPKLTLLVFDLDADGRRLKASMYGPGYVPYFGVPGEDGRATSTAMEGSMKGEGAVDQITPRLLELTEKAM